MKILRLYIEKNVLNSEFTQEIINRNPKAEICILETYKEIKKNKLDSKDSFILIDYKGKFIRKCPGTKNHICCNYFVINWSLGCPFQCTYCYLNGYQNNEGIFINANIENIFSELTLLQEKHKFLRIGTGEYTDSIGMEKHTGFNKIFLPEALKFNNILFELKTKSNDIDFINELDIKDIHKLVFAWSLNPQVIVDTDELFASKVNDRISAAQKCQKMGFKVAFHFDPIIYWSGYLKKYQNLIDHLFENIDKDKIAWISLGALRFMPSVKKNALKKFQHTKIYYQELLPGLDNKLRYFIDLRIDIFKKIYNLIIAKKPKCPIYLCMESPLVWQKVGIKNELGTELIFG